MRSTPTHSWKMGMRAKLLSLLCGVALWLSSAVYGAPFSAYVLEALSAMPQGGGYAADRAAELRFSAQGVMWDAARQRLVISARGASPTFCSAACYLVLLQALAAWAAEHPRAAFSPRVWESLRVEAQHADGALNWGRMNANGPGCAKWVHDLGAGVNFTSPEAARPGDFLKFFRTPQIGGAGEKGHLVIFLGIDRQNGEEYIRFWSSNKPGGYSVRRAPLRTLHHLIFTRITHPENFSRAPHLTETDTWLHSLLTKPCSYTEIVKKCGIITTP